MWIIKAWQRISPEVTVKGFKKCCTFSAMDEKNGMAVRRIGILEVSVRNMIMLKVKIKCMK
jgi:hypothetical protein